MMIEAPSGFQCFVFVVFAAVALILTGVVLAEFIDAKVIFKFASGVVISVALMGAGRKIFQ